jgi:hypothetical protein
VDGLLVDDEIHVVRFEPGLARAEIETRLRAARTAIAGYLTRTQWLYNKPPDPATASDTVRILRIRVEPPGQ